MEVIILYLNESCKKKIQRFKTCHVQCKRLQNSAYLCWVCTMHTIVRHDMCVLWHWQVAVLRTLFVSFVQFYKFFYSFSHCLVSWTVYLCLFCISDSKGGLWSALFLFVCLCSVQQFSFSYFCAWFVMCWFCFFFLSFTHISTHLCIASSPSLFSTTNRVWSPLDQSQAAPEQQRLDDAIGFLRDHAEVIARAAFICLF